MTTYEKLMEELGAAIVAVYGEKADNEYTKGEITAEDINVIAHKVKFYLDL